MLVRVRSTDPTYPPVEAGDTAASFADWLEGEPALHRWIAFDGATVRGHIQLADAHPYLTDALRDLDVRASHPVVEVGRLFVDPTARHHGFGAQLLSAARNHASAHSLLCALAVVHTSHAAIRLYEREGMTHVGSFHGDHGLNHVYMD
jgi:GNAT superfamily N-acetyltransferase